MTKALEVTVDGKTLGLVVPQDGRDFFAILGNIPKTFMRVQVLSGSANENWQYQFPDIHEGQTVSFKMVETDKRGLSAPYVRPLTEEEKLELKESE